jgi:hypothetical protein
VVIDRKKGKGKTEGSRLLGFARNDRKKGKGKNGRKQVPSLRCGMTARKASAKAKGKGKGQAQGKGKGKCGRILGYGSS